MDKETKEVSKLDRLLKFSIVIGILLISWSVAYYYLMFLPDHEAKKLASQELEEITKQDQQKEEQTKKEEQEQKEYVVKRKDDCYDIYLSEKEQWDNVKDFNYEEIGDVCVVKYESKEVQKSEEECQKIFDTLSPFDLGTVIGEVVNRQWRDCIDNTESRGF